MIHPATLKFGTTPQVEEQTSSAGSSNNSEPTTVPLHSTGRVGEQLRSVATLKETAEVTGRGLERVSKVELPSESRPIRKGAMYPGTFDPPTIAHLAIMTSAVRKAGVERLVVLVNQGGSSKTYKATAEQRRQMIIAGLPPDVRDRIDVRVEPKDGKNAVFAKLQENSSLPWYGLIGEDGFNGLPEHLRSDPDRNWLIVHRGEGRRPWAGIAESLNISGVGEGVSSSKVRSNLAEGKSSEGMLHPEVETFIEENGLYKTPPPGEYEERANAFENLWQRFTPTDAAEPPPFIPTQSPNEWPNYMQRYAAGLVG